MSLLDWEPGWYWVLGAALLALAELVMPGVFLVWIAAAALLTSLFAFAGVSFTIQLVIFGVASVATVFIARNSQRRTQPSDDPLLNDRAARLLGQSVLVCESIDQGQGRVKVGDGEWPARGPDVPAGTLVRVTGIEGGHLLVRPIDSVIPTA